MNDIVQFTVKLKDLMSGGMQKIASTSQASFRAVDSALARTQRSLTRTRLPIDDLNSRLDQLTKTRNLSVDTSQIKKANREVERLERQIERTENLGRRNKGGGGMGLLGMVGGVRGLAAGTGIAALIAGIGMATSTGMQGSAQKVSFETMAGKKEGGKLYGDLTQFAQQSIFGNELYGNAQTMLAFGASVKEVMPDLKMLGDISMGNKDRLQSLTLAFSQVRASGKLMGQDLLQLINAGFNPLQIISEKTGKSMAQLRSDMESGLISFDMVKKAFEAATEPGGRFFQMTQKIGETPFGKWEAFKGQLQGLALQLGTSLLPIAGKVIDVLSQMAGSIPAVISSLQPFFDMLANAGAQDYFTTLVSGLKDLGIAIIPIFNELKPLISTVLSTVFELSKKLVANLAPAFQKVAPILQDVAHILSTVLSPEIRIVGWALGKLVDVAGWLVDKITAIIKPVIKLISWVSDGIGGILNGAANIVDPKKAGGNSVLKAIVQPQLAIAAVAPAGASGTGSGISGANGFNFSGASQGITGGGARQIIINVNRSFVEGGMHVHTQNFNNGMNELEHKVQEIFLRLLHSANSVD